MVNPVKIKDNEYKLLHAENVLHYEFSDKNLLLKALTHPSAVQGGSVYYTYERLEFLGDSLLSSYVALKAYEKYPDMNEGDLTRIRVALVSGESLSTVAKEIGLTNSIIFGQSERNTGSRGLKSALENVFEALIAAIFLDGGIDPMQSFIDRTLICKMDKGLIEIKENPKSLLQEVMQRLKKTPRYSIIKEFGPPHNKKFIAEVYDENVVLASGMGRTKKEAEMNAAAAALKQIKLDK